MRLLDFILNFLPVMDGTSRSARVNIIWRRVETFPGNLHHFSSLLKYKQQDEDHNRKFPSEETLIPDADDATLCAVISTISFSTSIHSAFCFCYSNVFFACAFIKFQQRRSDERQANLRCNEVFPFWNHDDAAFSPPLRMTSRCKDFHKRIKFHFKLKLVNGTWGWKRPPRRWMQLPSRFSFSLLMLCIKKSSSGNWSFWISN